MCSGDLRLWWRHLVAWLLMMAVESTDHRPIGWKPVEGNGKMGFYVIKKEWLEEKN